MGGLAAGGLKEAVRWKVLNYYIKVIESSIGVIFVGLFGSDIYFITYKVVRPYPSPYVFII